jgi:hypothetical protein
MTRASAVILARAACFVPAFIVLAGCAALPAASQADDANQAACTQQADAAYRANNYDSLARTSQTGVYFSPMPNHVFDAQQMGSLSARNNQINDCVQNGNTTRPVIPGAPLPAPQIIGPSP